MKIGTKKSDVQKCAHKYTHGRGIQKINAWEARPNGDLHIVLLACTWFVSELVSNPNFLCCVIFGLIFEP